MVVNIFLKKAKNVIYLVDRVCLRSRLSGVINHHLMKKNLSESFQTSSGFFPVKCFLNASELTGLADKHKTDKGGVTNIKKGPRATHSYTYFYELLFSHCRESISRVLECGIGTNFEDVASNMSMTGTPGASLRMWEEYFPNAEVIGVDIDSRVLFSTDRIKTYQLDQTSVESIERFKCEIGNVQFDLIIDDGLHTLEAAKSLFENIFSHLKTNGIYVIEDVSPWNLKNYVKWLETTRCNFMIIPLFGMANIPSDDLLIVIQNDGKLLVN
jgi:SAM-dependent methyltransferase